MNVGMGLRGPTGYVAAIAAAGSNDARASALIGLFITAIIAIGTAVVAPFLDYGLIAPALAVVLIIGPALALVRMPPRREQRRQRHELARARLLGLRKQPARPRRSISPRCGWPTSGTTASSSLSLDPRPVVLTGPNGAGKTNLLEAVSFLSPGRGLRRAALDAVARQSGDGSWAVAATVVNASGAVDLGTGVTRGPDGPDGARRLRVNHAAVRSTEALLEHLRVLWLTPAMDGLFTGPASDRRRFLDRAVLAIDRQHGTRFNAFEKAMRGRNKLLSEPGPDRAWLDAIETEMAELASPSPRRGANGRA